MNRSALGLRGVVALFATSGLVIACSSSTSTPAASATQSTAAAVTGPADSHCGTKVVKVDQAVCHVVVDAGDADGGAGDVAPYGDTLYGSEGDDDDCKYHLTWTSSPMAEKSDVSFVITVTNKSDGSAVTGANPYTEILLTDTHPAPNTPETSSEAAGGIYTIGPIQFDAAGKWLVRFHLAGQCTDSEASPHGHAAFYVTVP